MFIHFVSDIRFVDKHEIFLSVELQIRGHLYSCVRRSAEWTLNITAIIHENRQKEVSMC